MSARETVREATTEAEFMAWVIDLARMTGWRTYHTRDSRGSEPGWPDLVLCRPPELIVSECKPERGRVTAEQERWLTILADSGVETYTWRPRDQSAIVARLRRSPS